MPPFRHYGKRGRHLTECATPHSLNLSRPCRKPGEPSFGAFSKYDCIGMGLDRKRVFQQQQSVFRVRKHRNIAGKLVTKSD